MRLAQFEQNLNVTVSFMWSCWRTQYAPDLHKWHKMNSNGIKWAKLTFGVMQTYDPSSSFSSSSMSSFPRLYTFNEDDSLRFFDRISIFFCTFLYSLFSISVRNWTVGSAPFKFDILYDIHFSTNSTGSSRSYAALISKPVKMCMNRNVKKPFSCLIRRTHTFPTLPMMHRLLARQTVPLMSLHSSYLALN